MTVRPALIAALALLAGGFAGLHAAPSQRLSLDGAWRFHLAPDAAAADALRFFYRDDFDASAFVPIPVPSNWTTQGFEEPSYAHPTASEGFYLHTFAVPADAKNQRALLYFGGVWESAEVWLNGRYLGRHDSGFTETGFDATEALRPGKDNHLAVRVRQRVPHYDFDANDDWVLPGIFRSVWLAFTPKNLYLEGVWVVTDFDGQFHDATLKLRAHVMHHENGWDRKPWPCNVTAILSRADGQEIQRTSSTADFGSPNGGVDVPLNLLVRAPAPWTAETPNLYDLRVEVSRDGQIIQSWNDRIGFREVSTSGGVLRINGQTVKLRGVARHDEWPEVGRATRREHWLKDIELMKAANINTVRTAHYPPAEGFVRLCDELGLYVLEEVPYGYGGGAMDDPSAASAAYLRVHETVQRDRNRPSIIIWDLGNEDPLTEMHVSTLRALKGLDPTRSVLMPQRADQDLPPEIDILAPHYRSAAVYDETAAVARRPLITTEYTHALGPDDFGGLQERWDAITRHPAGAGAMIWVWADQGLLRHINGRPVLDPARDMDKYAQVGSELVRLKDAGPGEIYDAHGTRGTDGIVDPDRTPQRDYWETKAVYAPVRVLTGRLPFQPGQPDLAIDLRNDYDFTDLSTVGIAWQLFHDADIVASGQTHLAAAPHATATLTIPTATTPPPRPGAACYVHLTFTDPAGAEITRRSVRLDLPPTAAAGRDAAPATNLPPPTVAQPGDRLVVTAGDTRIEFDRTTGELTALEVGGVTLAHGCHLAVWRTPTLSDFVQLEKLKPSHNWDTYLQHMTAHARAFSHEVTPAGVRVVTSVEYRADEKNTIDLDAAYTVSPEGALSIDTVVRPRVEVPWLPEIGLDLETGGAIAKLDWLGLGPVDSLPNRHASALFGLWSAAAGEEQAHGTKWNPDWLRLHLPNGRALLVRGAAGFRLEGGPGPAQRLRLLTRLAGARTKFHAPERPEWRIDPAGDRPFFGSIILSPEP